MIKPRRLTVLAAAVWTTLIGASHFLNTLNDKDAMMDEATAEAKANLNKDISFRRWGTAHGGVYVPVTDTQKSVPWLAHVPGRDVVTTEGQQLTLLNPATMLRQVMDRHAIDFGVQGRITGLKYLNPANAPDAWEAEQLKLFERGQTKEIWARTDIDGQPYLRYLRAMYMEPGCDKCHAILGYKTGDLRGATGIRLPLAGYETRLSASHLIHTLSHGGLWLVGLLGIAWIGRRSELAAEERDASAKQIAKAEHWYRSLFEQSLAGILIFDPASELFVDFNRLAHEILGYTREEFVGIQASDFEVEQTPEGRASRIQKINDTGWDRFETRYRKKSGELIDVQVSIQQLMLNDTVVFLTLFVDITERKRNEAELDRYRLQLEDKVTERTHELAQRNAALNKTLEQLQATQKQLVQSEKLSSLGALVAGISHEINTPIGNSMTIATTLNDQSKDFLAQLHTSGAGIKRSDLEHYVERMTEGSALLESSMIRATELIQSFKRVAVDRTSSLRRAFDLKSVISDVLTTMQPRIKKTPFSVEQDIPAGVLLDGPPGALGQVIVNLVENAFLHAFGDRTEGSIRISSGTPQDGWIKLIVEDNGRGIAEKHVTRIFDPFFTTRMGQGGSGLGLSIVHNIVSGILGGSIAVDTEIGRGTRFIIMMPVVAPPDPEA